MNRTTALPVGDWPDGDMIAMYHVGGCWEFALFVTAEEALTYFADPTKLPEGIGRSVCSSCYGEIRRLALSRVRRGES